VEGISYFIFPQNGFPHKTALCFVICVLRRRNHVQFCNRFSQAICGAIRDIETWFQVWAMANGRNPYNRVQWALRLMQAESFQNIFYSQLTGRVENRVGKTQRQRDESQKWCPDNDSGLTRTRSRTQPKSSICQNLFAQGK